MTEPLIVVRHGETDWNRERRYQGQRDIPLNARGTRQARRNGRVLAQLDLLQDITRLLVSPLCRTRDTAALLLEEAQSCPAAPALDGRLIERTFGDWEGRTLRDLQMKEPAILSALHDDPWSFRPPGGENFNDLCYRIDPLLRSLDGPTLLVAHGGTLKGLYHRLAGIDPAAACVMEAPQDRVVIFRQGRFVFI